MKALLKNGKKVSVEKVRQPTLNSSDSIIIRVAAAGICRTDIYVAEGLIPTPKNLILGHEFSGTITDVGVCVTSFKAGDRVTVMPAIPCGECRACRRQDLAYCLKVRMLGVDCNGAFAEFISVPASVVYPLPNGMSFKLGAYVEPMAASLSVLKANLQPQERGLLYGQNRIALLIKRVLLAHGISNIDIYNPPHDTLPNSAEYDFVIETAATNEGISEMVNLLCPKGKLIIKSRPPKPIAIDFPTAVKKELTIQAFNYGSFSEAITYLAERRIEVDDLLGSLHSLEEFESVFAEARANESSKIFFSLNEEVLS